MTEQTINQTPKTAPPKRRKTRKQSSQKYMGLIIAVIIIIVLVFLLIGTLFISINKIKELNKQITELKNTNEEIEKLIPTGEYFYKEDLKNKTIQYGLSLTLFQKLYPENIVFYGKDGITFEPLDEKISPNKLNLESFTHDEEEGFIYFDEKTNHKAKKGIDVSMFQKNINWKKVKESGIDFAIIRCGFRGYTTGKLMEDSTFEANIKGALENDIDVGVYFFSQAVNEMEAREEADFTAELIKKYNITYPVVFDMEDIHDDDYRTEDLTTAERTKIALAFCDQVEKHGYIPMIYGNIRWLIENYDIEKIMKYDIWLAQYQKNLYYPYKLDMWQYTHKGEFDGIPADVDINLCFKDYSAKSHN